MTGLWDGVRLNVREQPSLAARVVGQIGNESLIKPLAGVVKDGAHRWVEIGLAGGVRGWASAMAAGRLMTMI